MSKPYDASVKTLVEMGPGDWLRFIGHPSENVEVIDADLATVTASADKIVLVRDAEPWLLHLELQANYDATLPDRVLWYNTLLAHRHGLRTRSVVILLERRADSPNLTGVLERQFPGEPPYLQFRYRVLRLWEVPVETLLSAGLCTLPLAPLAAVTPEALPGVWQRMTERFEREAPDQSKILEAAARILMHLRYEEKLMETFMGIRGLEASPLYMKILQKGKEEGKEEGKVEGKAEGAMEELRRMLFRLGQVRFGPPSAAMTKAIEDTASVQKLEALVERVLYVSRWDDLLANGSPAE